VDIRDAQPAPAASRAATARIISAETYLTGAVHATGANVQSVVSLIRSSDDKTLWTGTFTGTVANWFPVEDRAASELLSALWHELPFVQHHTADPVADQLYWQARFAMHEGTPEGLPDRRRPVPESRDERSGRRFRMGRVGGFVFAAVRL
jgi:hypothetical protein